MIEKKEITKKLIQNTIINFIIFTLILIIFDFVIYNQVMSPFNVPPGDVDVEIEERDLSPKMIIVQKDEDGNVHQQDAGNLNKYLLNTLIYGTIIIDALIIILSYLLAKRAIKPIIDAYEKQTEFVENVSHELRTPLTIIQAKQELLLTQPDSKIIEKSEEINLSLQETRRLSKLIKELMELAKADKKDIVLEKEETDINELILKVAEPYKELANMQEKNMSFELEYNKKLFVNTNKINELFIIVLDNAIKYTDKGEEIKIKTYSKDGKCYIEICDTGIGISQEGLKHVFERFYREDKSRARQTGGNGLRTFYCKNNCRVARWNDKGYQE